MGMIGRLLNLVFGDGRNAVVQTVEVFRENAEAAGVRASDARAQAVAQLGAEFAQPRTGGFDRFVNGLNRLPRPLLAFGTIGLFAAAMADPVWFASRMQGLALVPEPLWWLMGAIVGFYFGARHQAHGQAFQREIAATMAQVPQVMGTLREIAALREPAAESPGAAASGTDAALTQAASAPSGNAALDDWRRSRVGAA